MRETVREGALPTQRAEFVSTELKISYLYGSSLRAGILSFLPRLEKLAHELLRTRLSQKFWAAPQGGSPTVNRGEPGFKGRIEPVPDLFTPLTAPTGGRKCAFEGW